MALTSALDLERDGARLLPRMVAEEELRDLEALLRPVVHGGVRLTGVPRLAAWMGHHMAPSLLASIGDGFRPVRAILFDKRAGSNWTLGWHQDRTVAVRKRRPAEGYGTWSTKQGVLHVEPPFAVIDRMRTARLHLDPVSRTNAPLRVALGSHRLGAVADHDAAMRAEALPTLDCVAERGDCWLYATPILHASGPVASSTASHRRVLQIDFSRDVLPGGVEWLGLEDPPRLSESSPATKSRP